MTSLFTRFCVGPPQWHKQWPVAALGSRQSPVDIVTTEASKDKQLSESPLIWTYVENALSSLENTGASWKFNADTSGSCKWILM
jgi:carbonic anhydrase